MKFMVVGDVHLTDPKSSPSVRSESYTEDILAKLDFVAETAADQECAAILILGDLFHLKAPSRNSHWLVQRTHEVLTSKKIPVIVVPGNHDLQHDRLDSLESQPLGALGRMEGIEILDGAHQKFPIFGIPYLQDWHDLPYYIEAYTDCNPRDDGWIVGMHAPIFPPGEEPPYEYLASEDVAQALSYRPHTLVAYGHIHDPHGFYQPEPDGPEFANLGAISRGSLHAETLKRKPQVYVYDVVDGEAEIFDVPHRPIEEVFALQAVLSQKQEAVKMTDFLAGLDSSALTMTSTDAVVAAAKDAELQPTVIEAVVQLIEYAS